MATSNEQNPVAGILDRAVHAVRYSREQLTKALGEMKRMTDDAIKRDQRGFSLWTMVGGSTAFLRAAEEVESANREYHAAVNAESSLRHAIATTMNRVITGGSQEAREVAALVAASEERLTAAIAATEV